MRAYTNNIISQKIKSKNFEVQISKSKPFLRYPGGKQRHLPYFERLLPARNQIAGRYVEPFVGGGSVFFHINPKRAILSDKNPEIIDLYIAIREVPEKVWELYSSFPKTKEGYYNIRDTPSEKLDLIQRAARTLFLNRTCFKGMWRHNSQGKFNVGYGGQDRRWVITQQKLQEISKCLSNTNLRCCDFESLTDGCIYGDFLFIDPPYCPGKKEQHNNHYNFGSFSYEDQKRLAKTLHRATNRGVFWLMTNSANPSIKELYEEYPYIPLQRGTGKLPGLLTKDKNEIIIYNLPENFHGNKGLM